MITIIAGDVGSGKTALMTMLAVTHMTELAHDDLSNCRKEVKRFNKGGYSFTVPKKHIVFADYPIRANKRRISYEIDGYRLGLPNDQGHETVFIPPCSHVYLDEAQRYYNSRKSSVFPDFVSRFYETHRHYKLNITLACQRSTLIDLNIREISGQIIEVAQLKHSYDRNNRIKRTVWKCIEFYSYFDYQNYLNSGKTVGGQTVKYQYEGDIFTAYNSYGFMPLHLRNRKTADFELVTASQVGYNAIAIERYNEVHDYQVPKTFYQGQSGAPAPQKGSKNK